MADASNDSSGNGPESNGESSGLFERLEAALADINRTLVTFNHSMLLLGRQTDQKVAALYQHLSATSQLLNDRHIAELQADPRHADPLLLVRHGFKAFSQNDEDGIIQEIFARIGTTDRRFIEFGVEDGTENNTVYLLAQGWSGLWIEGSSAHAQKIRTGFARPLAERQLTLHNAFVTRDTIDDLIRDAGFTGEIDLLSVDIDGNDYHVLEAITAVQPRAIVVEYNGKFRPPVRWIMPYDELHQWDGSAHFGASLSAFTDLLDHRGYRLVGCNLTGANAFFVRADLAEGRFAAPFTAEHHYQPPRYYLTSSFVAGHPARRAPV